MFALSVRLVSSVPCLCLLFGSDRGLWSLLCSAALQVAEALLVMQRQTLWEVRHGSMLALKYLMAVRSDLLSQLLPMAAPVLMAALRDPDDDVRGAAAESLHAVATHAAQLIAPLLPTLLSQLSVTCSSLGLMNGPVV